LTHSARHPPASAGVLLPPGLPCFLVNKDPHKAGPAANRSTAPAEKAWATAVAFAHA